MSLPFNLKNYEYEQVIVNSSNVDRLTRAWEKKIDCYCAMTLIEGLIAGEGINVEVIFHDSIVAYAYRSINNRSYIKLGTDLSAGLIYHEYAHVILFEREENSNHGPLFTATLDMLLHKYEEDWL